MKKLTFGVFFAALFIGLCGATHCGPRDLNDSHPKRVCRDGEIVACDTGDLGVCAEGIKVCADGVYSECQQVNSPTVESCDGRDNDCNGQNDGVCYLELDSLPEYDGHYYHSNLGMDTYNHLKVSGHGYLNGISDYPLPERQSAFVTFDLNEFTGAWNQVVLVNVRVHMRCSSPYPYADPPALPEMIEVRLWELNNDYSQVTDCSYTSLFQGCGGPHGQCYWDTTFEPPGCEFPNINYSDLQFIMDSSGDGWYDISEEDSLILYQLLNDHAGQKLSLWLDYDAMWCSINDEQSSTPPALDFIYYE